MVSAQSFDITPTLKAQSKAPCLAICGQPYQPFDNLQVLVTQHAFIPIAAFSDLKHTAGQGNADTTGSDRFHAFFQIIPSASRFACTNFKLNFDAALAEWCQLLSAQI